MLGSQLLTDMPGSYFLVIWNNNRHMQNQSQYFIYKNNGLEIGKFWLMITMVINNVVRAAQTVEEVGKTRLAETVHQQGYSVPG